MRRLTIVMDDDFRQDPPGLMVWDPHTSELLFNGSVPHVGYVEFDLNPERDLRYKLIKAGVTLTEGQFYEDIRVKVTIPAVRPPGTEWVNKGGGEIQQSSALPGWLVAVILLVICLWAIGGEP